MQNLYRQALSRLMLKRAGRAVAPTAEAAEPEAAPPVASYPDAKFFDTKSPLRPSAEAAALLRDVVRARWRLAFVYVLAGIPQAVMLGLYFARLELQSATGQYDREFTSRFPPIYVAMFCWPIISVVSVVVVAYFRQKFLAVLVYFLLLIVASLFAQTGSIPWHAYVVTGIFLSLIYLFVPTCLFLALRSLKAIGTVVGLITSLLLIGVVTALRLVALDALEQERSWMLLAVLTCTCFVALAVVLVKRLRRLYASKRMSDQSLLLDSYLLFVAVWAALLNWYLSPPRWRLNYGQFMFLLLSFAVYKILLWAGLRLLRRRAPHRRNVRLLLLRAFGRFGG